MQLVEEWLAEHLISYLMALLAKLEIRRLKNLEILRSVKQTLLFLLVNGGVDLGGNDTLLTTGRETSDLGVGVLVIRIESDLRENSPKYQFPSRWRP